MIWETLSFITGKLNTAIKSRYGVSRNIARIGTPPATGQSNPDADNAILVTLVNVEPEYVAADSKKQFKQTTSPDLYVNLYVLVSASSTDENYDQALKMLAGIMSFFQTNPVFDGRAESSLPASIDRLSLEIVKLSMHEMSNMWTAIGSKYAPSVLYKIRLLRFQNEKYSPEWPPVSGVVKSG
jgi:hypothetical protein